MHLSSEKAPGLQALPALERARYFVAGVGALCMLAMSAMLGRGAAPISTGFLGLTAGVAISVGLPKCI